MLYRRLLRPYLLQEQSLIDRPMARASDELQAVVDRGREVGARTRPNVSGGHSFGG